MHRLVTLTAASLLAYSLLAADKKTDPDEIGNRDVGKGVNFYSIEKEIALGKGLASEVERQAKIINDPVIAEYVNRLGQNLVRNSDAKGSLHDQSDRHRRSERVRSSRRILFCELRLDPEGGFGSRIGRRDGA